MSSGAIFSAHLDLHLNEAFGDELRGRIQQGMEEGFRQMVRVAARLSPYRTGNNARLISWTTNWHATAENAKRSITLPKKRMAGAIYTQSGYGGYLELGTSRMHARPYIRPAVEQEINYMLERIKAQIAKGGYEE